MDAPRPPHRFAPNSTTPLFIEQPPDHVPPENLTDEALDHAIRTLRAKLYSARRTLRITRLACAVLAAAIFGAGFTLLWAGPAPFFERFLSNGHVTTTYDATVWWIALLALAIVGGAFGDQILRGRLRLIRGWAHRVHELQERLAHAETVRERRLPP